MGAYLFDVMMVIAASAILTLFAFTDTTNAGSESIAQLKEFNHAILIAEMASRADGISTDTGVGLDGATIYVSATGNKRRPTQLTVYGGRPITQPVARIIDQMTMDRQMTITSGATSVSTYAIIVNPDGSLIVDNSINPTAASYGAANPPAGLCSGGKVTVNTGTPGVDRAPALQSSALDCSDGTMPSPLLKANGTVGSGLW